MDGFLPGAVNTAQGEKDRAPRIKGHESRWIAMKSLPATQGRSTLKFMRFDFLYRPNRGSRWCEIGTDRHYYPRFVDWKNGLLDAELRARLLFHGII